MKFTRTTDENVWRNIGVRCTFVRIDVFKNSLSDEDFERLVIDKRRFLIWCDGVTLLDDNVGDELLFIDSNSDSSWRKIDNQLIDVMGFMYQSNA